MQPRPRKINQWIDLVWEEPLPGPRLEGRPRIYVDGKPFLYCAFLVASIDTSTAADIRSVDEIAQLPGAHRLEGDGVTDVGISPEEQMWGFASSLQGWAESGYNTRAIHSNLAFPLLKELAKVGDPTARRVLQWELIERLEEGSEVTATVILETCGDIMDAKAWHALMPALERAIDKQVKNPDVVYRPLASEANDLVSLVAKRTDLPEEIMTALVKSKIDTAVDVVMERFVVAHGEKGRSFVGHDREWLKFALAEIAKTPRIYDEVLRSILYGSIAQAPAILDIMEDVLSRNTNHQYDALVESFAHKVGHKQLARILEAALFTRLTKVEPRTPQELRVKILAKAVENPSATLPMLQRIVDNMRFMDGGSGAITNAVYTSNTFPGLDITPRVRNESTHYEHVVKEKPFAGYSVALVHGLEEHEMLVDQLHVPISHGIGRTFAHFKDKLDLILLSIKQTEGDHYYGKVTLVSMDGAEKGFNSWGKRNGWTHCLYADGFPVPKLTDAWFKHGYIYFLAQGTPRAQYWYDKDNDKLVKE